MLKRNGWAATGAITVLIVAFAAFAVVEHRRLGAARVQLETLAPGPVDSGFVLAMSAHHQQAVVIANLMLQNPLDQPQRTPPSVFALAARAIADAQLLELGEMRGWLRLWQQPLTVITPGMDWLLLGDSPLDAEYQQYLLDCRQSPTGMPGLASAAELNALRLAEGRARDELFLTLMIAHHRGALPMARFAAQYARLPSVRELARQIVLGQAEEIQTLERLQSALASSAQ